MHDRTGPDRRMVVGGMLASSTASRAAPVSYVFFASVGSAIFAYRVDPAAGALVQVRGPFPQPEEVQCCWQDPRSRRFYVACSDQFTTKKGHHTLGAFSVGPSGALVPLGDPVPLKARPIYITGDHSGRYILAAYNLPAGLSVHGIDETGAAGAARQELQFDAGSYPHQVRVFPSNRAVLVMTRGNEPAQNRPEDPGALHVLTFADGKLTPSQVVAPGKGLHFRARHADFHPSGRWLYVVLESQNQVQAYKIDRDRLSETPLFSASTLADPASVKPGQMASAIQVHPGGRILYVANRGTGVEDFHGQQVSNGGENSVAVFALDPVTGAPRRIQNSPVAGVHPRTISLSPDARWLLAATIRPAKMRRGGNVETVQAALTLFGVAGGGRLTFRSKRDIDAGTDQVFWSGPALC